MSAQTLQAQIETLRRKIVGLQADRTKHVEAAQKAQQNARRKLEQASKTKSESSRKSYGGQADREEKKAIASEKKADACAVKISNLERQLTAKRKSFDTASKRENSRAERDRVSKQRAMDRDTKKRRADELKHARELVRSSRPIVRHVPIPEPKPEKLRILYLTANADMDQPLRTDAEVGGVLRELRGTRYRDLVELQSRPAATSQDLLNGINDVTPHIIHFSGHGAAGLLQFDNSSLNDPQSVTVEFDILAEVLGATDRPPTLLVMNACSTLHGSDILLEVVPVLVAMKDPVGDAAAGVFAMQFYSAIASGQSIDSAFAQAKVAIKMSLFKEDAELPQLLARTGTDLTTVALVGEGESVKAA